SAGPGLQICPPGRAPPSWAGPSASYPPWSGPPSSSRSSSWPSSDLRRVCESRQRAVRCRIREESLTSPPPAVPGNSQEFFQIRTAGGCAGATVESSLESPGGRRGLEVSHSSLTGRAAEARRMPAFTNRASRHGGHRAKEVCHMAARSCWKGFLRLSLVAVPVKAHPASVSGGGDICLHQLHAGCHQRIRYHKVCPRHGEVQSDAIVSGYEYSKDQYVVVDPAELDQLRSQADHAITIAEFIAPTALDPVYASGKSYYLLPDGPVGHKPYAVRARAMHEAGRHAIARVVLHGREQVVLVRPVERLLVLSVLHHDQQITRPACFQADLPALELPAEELKLARTLIDASTNVAFDLACYPDVYTDQLRCLIEAKAAG